MATFRESITGYADQHWHSPCKDGIAWVYYGAINVHHEIGKRKLAAGEWRGAFLRYEGKKSGASFLAEGLYLIKVTSGPKLLTTQLATDFPEAIMICSWFDNAGDEMLTHPPEYHGLNDCAHFVTECLAAGGILMRTPSVPMLLNSLTAHSSTKTLCRTVQSSLAKRMIDAKVLQPGDVIIFSKTATKHGHSAIYLGNGKMAMHTYSNHANSTLSHGDWQGSVTDEHNLVTLIHWGNDDARGAVSSAITGYWQVLWRGTNYFYQFQSSGRVVYSKKKPASLSSPLSSIDGKGYWFESATGGVNICWSSTGSFEQFLKPTGPTGSAMGGVWNDSEPLVAMRL